MRVTFYEALFAGAASGIVGYVADDWIAAASVLVLLVGWKLVDTRDRLFVLPAAFAFHWSQTSLGMMYLAFTGREVPTVYLSDYRPMVLIGLGCCLAIAVGIRLGTSLIAAPDPDEERPGFAFSFGLLATAYVTSVIFEGVLSTLAGDYVSLRQIIVTFDSVRLCVLFLILRRLLHPVPRYGLVAAVVMLEIVMGITGFFAGFREPVVLAAIAMLEIFDRRNARHWMALAASFVFAIALGLIWMGIRVQYRRDYVDMDNFQTSRSARVERVQGLTSDFLNSDPGALWETADNLVDRMWTVYYPALAMKRVPDTLAHTDGAFVKGALLHIVTPRVFFPNKANLVSDSEKVRKYTGVMVAGEEQNTSIAFGYSAEAYIDYGIPWMFAPVFGFGLALGLLYAFFRKILWHRELFVSFATVTFWLSLYLFERSWGTMLGVSLGFMIYLGIPVILLDRFLLVKFFAMKRERDSMLFSERNPSHTF